MEGMNSTMMYFKNFCMYPQYNSNNKEENNMILSFIVQKFPYFHCSGGSGSPSLNARIPKFHLKIYMRF
jgi:hypothetical protein